MSQGIANRSSRDLDDQAVHRVLSNERRRYLFDILQKTDNDLSVRELSERIAVEESGENPPPGNLRRSVYVSLLQNHLPMLDEQGIIEYDDQAKEVRVADGLNDVMVLMETVPKYGLSRSEFVGALALLGLLMVYAAHVGTPLIAAVSPLTWAAVFLLAVSVTGLYYTLQQRRTVAHYLWEWLRESR